MSRNDDEDDADDIAFGHTVAKFFISLLQFIVLAFACKIVAPAFWGHHHWSVLDVLVSAFAIYFVVRMEIAKINGSEEEHKP